MVHASTKVKWLHNVVTGRAAQTLAPSPPHMCSLSAGVEPTRTGPSEAGPTASQVPSS